MGSGDDNSWQERYDASLKKSRDEARAEEERLTPGGAAARVFDSIPGGELHPLALVFAVLAAGVAALSVVIGRRRRA